MGGHGVPGVECPPSQRLQERDPPVGEQIERPVQRADTNEEDGQRPEVPRDDVVESPMAPHNYEGDEVVDEEEDPEGENEGDDGGVLAEGEEEGEEEQGVFQFFHVVLFIVLQRPCHENERDKNVGDGNRPVAYSEEEEYEHNEGCQVNFKGVPFLREIDQCEGNEAEL